MTTDTNYTQVNVPSEYFFKMSCRDYSDWKTALMRELFQNSIDAGASEIRVTLDESNFTFRDDGVGMSESTILNSFLTLGGTYKDNEKATGGHGKAKELIAFSWESWSLLSNDSVVSGKGGTYKIENSKEFFEGTMLQIFFGTRVTKSQLTNSLLNFVDMSNLEIDIYLNGEVINSSKNVMAKHCYDIPELGKLYEVESFASGYVDVLVNGNWMFREYSILEKCYQFNIDMPSYECLTSNRDGFNMDYRRQFMTMLSKIAIDSESTFIKKEFVMTIAERTNDPSYAKIKNSEIGKTIASYNQTTQTEVTDSMVDDFFDNQPLVVENIINTTQDTTLRTVIKTVSTSKTLRKFQEWFRHNFDEGFLLVADDKITGSYVSQIFTIEDLKTAVLWRSIVHKVMKLNNIELPIGFGFVVNDDTIAQCRPVEDVNYLLINPYKTAELDWTETIAEMYITACHELTHSLGFTVHNETFIAKSENLMRKCFTTIITEDDLKGLSKVRKTIEG